MATIARRRKGMPFNKLVRVLLRLFAIFVLETFRPRRTNEEPLEVVLR
jgi:hypothetical protein